jgi:DNA-binding transcriptional LysR family regulator
MDLVAEFLAGHPKLRIELTLEDCGIDFLSDRVDLMLRIGSSREPTLISVPLCELPIVLCATPDYLARAGVPDALDDLANHACIVNSELDSTEKWWPDQRLGSPDVKVNPRVRVNNDVAARALVRAGLGVGLLARQPINIDLQHGRLIEVLEGHGPSSGLVHAVFPRDSLLSRPTRLFLKFLKERLRGA